MRMIEAEPLVGEEPAARASVSIDAKSSSSVPWSATTDCFAFRLAEP